MAKTENNKDSIEKLSERLYRPSGSGAARDESTLHRASFNAEREWKHGEREVSVAPAIPQDSSAFFKKILLGSLIFFVASSALAVYMIYGGGNVVSSDKISISILGPAFTEGGNEFELQFDIKNGNQQAIEYADLAIEYPKGATLEGDKNTVRVRKFLGEIRAGKSASQLSKIVLFGEEGSERTVKVALEYRVEGSNAIFVKEASYLVRIKSSPLILSAQAQKEVNSNQDFKFAVTVTANAERPVEGVLLKVEYPSGFTFTSAAPSPAFGNNIWDLGDLSRGAKKAIEIHGTISGEDGEERSFRVYAGTQSEDDEQELGVVYNSLLQPVLLKRPFLEAKLSINNEVGNSFVVNSGTTIEGDIDWINNLPNRVADAELYVRFSGSALDKSSVSAVGAFFSSSDNTLTWNKETFSQFASVGGGESGRLRFSFRVLPLFSGGQTTFKNPELALEVGVRGRRILENNVPEEITASVRKSVRVNSNVQLLARMLYYSGVFTNTGSVPPKVDRETTYTVLWSMLNSSNDLGKARVVATLPSYVRFTGNSSPSEEISYNEETRELTWDLGRVAQGTGVEKAPRQASFQIAFTPSLSQAGSPAALTGEISVSADDEFTGGGILFSRSALTTSLSGDPTAKSGDDIIVK